MRRVYQALCTIMLLESPAWAQDPSAVSPALDSATTTNPSAPSAVPNDVAPETKPSTSEVPASSASTPSPPPSTPAPTSVVTPQEPAPASVPGATETARLAEFRVEKDLFVFGIFPNSEGFMDARLHVRQRYLRHLSAGLYFDYTTAKALVEEPEKMRNDRLVREYRFEADLVKGIVPVMGGGGKTGTVASVEPGINAKYLHQNIQESGYVRNSFGDTVFRGTTTNLNTFIGSLKLEGTVDTGGIFTLDIAGEWLPLVYTREKSETQSSQFNRPVTSSVSNRTSGWQATATATVNLDQYGKYALRAKGYRNSGEVSARALMTSGNFEYEFETFSKAVREDYWIELIHTATYYKLFGVIAPAIGVAYQRKRFETRTDSMQADTFKLGLLLETP